MADFLALQWPNNRLIVSEFDEETVLTFRFPGASAIAVRSIFPKYDNH
jgi:hypothetical protein